MRIRSLKTLPLLLPLLLAGPSFAIGEQNQTKAPAPSRVLQTIDAGNRIALQGHVLKGLTPERDLGAVEDSKPTRLYLNLKRTLAQQADLDALLAHQQEPGSPDFHKFLTPQQFGARFGASQQDIHKITLWLASQGFEVTSVAHNASVINFMATAGSVRHTFHADLHYWNVEGGKHVATKTEPEIPGALADVVASIAGLNQIPPHTHHTPIKQEAYDAETHKWHTVDAAKTIGGEGAKPHYLASDGHYNMTPQDYYTIYNVNPTYAAGNHGEGTTIAIVAFADFNYGTVAADGTATGGDAATFRSLFGVTLPLNLKVQHGNANFPCSDPGNDAAASGEFALDTEWSGSLAPAAHIVLYSCGNATTAIQAIVDDNVADVISSSIGATEANVGSGDRQIQDNAFAQAAAQGQTYLSAQGDSGSNDFDFGSAQGTHGLSIDYPSANPLVLSIGGTDFQDTYDSQNGGLPQSTYWGSSNSKFYGDALGYVPEMTWNESCASPFIAMTPNFGGAAGETTATYCNQPQNGEAFGAGGGGGISSIYAQPSWQTGIPGLSAAVTNRATPDVSMFASGGGYWGHGTVLCDSTSASSACTSPDTFGGAGGTSFAAPEFAGILALLRTGTGSRQGLVQPALYALAKAQYTAGTACYANGQTANTGVTTGLPAASCIFHDVTTSGNNNECVAGSTNCFSNPGASYGVLTSSGDNSVFVDAYAAGAKYDIATGLGSVNVTNLINGWNTAFTSSTALTANPTSITTAQSTTLTATVTVGQPTGSTGQAPTLAGSINFATASTALGSCTLSGTSCSIMVAGSALPIGSDPIIATFVGSGTYPSSMSTPVNVTVTSSGTTGTTSTATISSTSFPASKPGSISVHVSCNSACGQATYREDGAFWATVTLDANGNFASYGTMPNTNPGQHTVTVSYLGNAQFAASTSNTVSFTIVSTTATTTTATISSTSFPASQPATITTHVSCNSACGQAIYREDGVVWAKVNLDAGGNFASFGPPPNTNPGQHTVTVSYLGNSQYAASTSNTVSFTIVTNTATTTTATISSTSFPASKPAIVSIHVSCNSACGKATYREDGVVWGNMVTLDANGNFASYGRLPNSNPGQHSVTVTYSGNSQYAASTSNTVSFTIQ